MNHLVLAASKSGSYVSQRDDCTAAFHKEFDYICVSLRRLGVNASDIEDLVHDVFLVSYRRWPDYDQSRPLKPYLFGILYRVAVGHFRRNRHHIHAEDDELELEDGAPRSDQAPAVEQARALVLKALESVPLKRRAVLVMHDIDEMRMQDIASTMSIPRFIAYSRLRKARKEFEAAVLRLQKGSDLR